MPNAAFNPCSIVTGAGRGIGKSIALRLAQIGPVVAVSRSASELDSLCQEISATGGTAAPLVGDVADPETAQRTISLVQSRGWTLQNLVCNAGIGKSSATPRLDLADWRKVFDVNVHGSFYFVHACLPLMIAQTSGTIVLMSSLAGVKGVAYDAAYTASKHALVGLSRSLALEVGKHGIVVAALCPGFVDTDMTQRTIKSTAKRQAISEDTARQKIADKHPLRRIMTPEEIAEITALVCSGTLASITGNPLILGGT